MAYSNWGAFVFCNGKRRRDKEDVRPFEKPGSGLQDCPSGLRIFAVIADNNANNNRQDWDQCQHSVLGDGNVRVCCYKAWPTVFVEKDGKVEEVTISYNGENPEGEVEVEGCKITWSICDGGEGQTETTLVEPDGKSWYAKTGYCYGAGHSDDYDPDDG